MNNTSKKNFAILAHVDAGKTTLTEQILYLAGAIREPGRVDSGTARTDSLAVERERGISVKAACASVEYGGATLNIIDTPGHVDFAGEVERCLCALDFAVVVLSAVEGVQSHTETIIRALNEYKLPYMIYINKIDRAGADTAAVAADLSELAAAPLLTLCCTSGEGGRDCSVSSLPDGRYADMLTETLADTDDRIAEAYLDGVSLTVCELEESLRRAVSQVRVIPVLCGSSLLGKGTRELCDFIARIMPNSEDTARRLGGTDKLSALVYKIEHDRVMGKLAYVRLFGGSLEARDTVVFHQPQINGADAAGKDDSGQKGSLSLSRGASANSNASANGNTSTNGNASANGNSLQNTSDGEKISQIRSFSGAKQIDTGRADAGDIAVLCGTEKAKTGMWLGECCVSESYRIAHPFLSVKVTPPDTSKLTQTIAALRELDDEEPLLSCRFEPTEREIVLSITGQVQLEIIDRLLRERFEIAATFSPPSVIYRETPSKSGYGFEAYTMPKPCWAVVRLLLEPLPRGSGVLWDGGHISHNKLFYKYQEHIRRSLFTAVAQGPLGWEVTDMRVTLADGEHHTIHTHPLDFFVATPMALADGLRNTGTTLLEPMLEIKITASPDCRGRIVNELMRISRDTDVIGGNASGFTVLSRAPAALCSELPVKVASISGGKALFSARFDGYDICPADRCVTAKRRGCDPLDRAKWILYARGAMIDSIV